ncbi:MAG: hypothetical protein GY820_40720 [Gammaproteobacteria bacterium]|nr:hypothetical protein [Gammaproteobacteria bacterium]
MEGDQGVPLDVKKLKILYLLMAFCFSVPCYGDEYSQMHRTSVKQAIESMLALTEYPDPIANQYLIIRVAGTQQFVQFANRNSGLVLDLPFLALSDKEAKIAKEYFKEVKVPHVSVSARDPKTEEIYELRSWSKKFSVGNVDNVVNIALGALYKIYGVSQGTKLILIKGWE